MVINQPPGDAANPERYYVFAEIRERVERYFCSDVDWAPISAQVREQIRRVAPGRRTAAHRLARDHRRGRVVDRPPGAGRRRCR